MMNFVETSFWIYEHVRDLFYFLSLILKNMLEKTYNPGKILQIESAVEYQAGSIVSREIYRTEAGTLTVFAFDEGQGLSTHTAPFDAFVQVLDGESKITIDNEEHVLKKGDLILMPTGHPHAVYAIKKFKMLLTMMKK